MDQDKKTIAVVGASADRRKFGNICVRAYKEAGWEVYPVNPQQTTIEELVVYPKLSQVPVELDRISVYLPPPTTRRLLGEIADKGADDVFFNPGVGRCRGSGGGSGRRHQSS